MKPLIALFLFAFAAVAEYRPPNIIVVLADDLGYGDLGCYGNKIVKTPHLDRFARQGLRFTDCYSAHPNCSPSRTGMMTGRTPTRVGVHNWIPMFSPMHVPASETTIASILQQGGYDTAHVGKWHLNGLRGPGAPILKDDIRSPAEFGFDEWLSVTNFFDMNPILSREGSFEEYEGDSSEIVVDQAIDFLKRHHQAGPTFTVIWYGTPHSPFMSYEKDRQQFAKLDDKSSSHYAELVAMDRSIGTLRTALRTLKIAKNTLLWFNSDNGGLNGIKPGTVGGLRGFKNTVYEGGLRVPAVIEWPNGIRESRITEFPACTMDIYPTLVKAAGAESSTIVQDGMDLTPLFSKEQGRRDKPIGFRHTGRTAWIDNNLKLVRPNAKNPPVFELYDLDKDPQESTNLFRQKALVAAPMMQAWATWNASVEASVAGKDYPEGSVVPPDPGPRTWPQMKEYAPYLEAWKNRPEFKRYIKSPPGK